MNRQERCIATSTGEQSRETTRAQNITHQKRPEIHHPKTKCPPRRKRSGLFCTASSRKAIGGGFAAASADGVSPNESEHRRVALRIGRREVVRICAKRSSRPLTLSRP